MSHAPVNGAARDTMIRREGQVSNPSSALDHSLIKKKDSATSGSGLLSQTPTNQVPPGRLVIPSTPSTKDKPLTKKYLFATTSSDILRKYSKFPPSLTLHIFDTFYRFNNANDSAPIPRSSPMMKDFLEHVLKEEIPAELSELLKDFSYRCYDGCLVLQVSDHRNMISVSVPLQPSNPPMDATKQEPPANQASIPNAPTTVSKPKTYRTLLRPTPLSLYYDLLYHTDAALTKFSDPLALQMESEILALTNRNLDLSVKLNPYDYPELSPPQMLPKVEDGVDSDDTKIVYAHREEVPVIPRKLHLEEQTLHKSSEYEELMLLMTNKHSKLDDLKQNKRLVVIKPTPSQSTSVSSPMKMGSKDLQTPELKHMAPDSSVPVVLKTATLAPSARTSGQFMRLRFIEEIRKKKDLEAQQAATSAKPKSGSAGVLSHTSAGMGTSGQILRPSPNQNQLLGQSRKSSMPSLLQSGLLNAKRQKVDSLSPAAPTQGQSPFSAAPAVTSMYNSMSPVGGSGAVPINSLHQGADQIDSGQRQQQSGHGPQLIQGQHLTQGQQQGQTQQPDAKPPHRQGLPPSSLQRQQQQQLFQSSLSPEEQQAFKQLQSKMSTFLQMGNTGSAPNGQQLTPHQKQQAHQQAKLVQQQLLQKFPVYFQRLRQFQLIQQQRQQRQAMSGISQDQSSQTTRQATPHSTNLPIPSGMNNTFHQNGMVMNSSAAGSMVDGQSPQSSDKRKRVYKKK